MKKSTWQVQAFTFRWHEKDYDIMAAITSCDCGLSHKIEIGGPAFWLEPNPLPQELWAFAIEAVRGFYATEFNAVNIDQWRASNELSPWQKELITLLPKEGA